MVSDRESLLAVAGAAKHFARPLFSDLTFALEPGSLSAIVGAVSAGKTTLLRCLAGVEPLTAGTITRTVPVMGLVTATRPSPGPVELLADPIDGPRVVVVDEPTLYLTDRVDDPYPRPEGEQVVAHLVALAEMGHAVVAATHDTIVVAAAMQHGQVIEL